MSRVVRRLTLAALLSGAAGAAFAVARPPMPTERSGTALDEAKVLELDLAFFESRVARDSFAARDHAELARLYLQRARVSGSADADLVRAEAHARRSLSLRTTRNAEALQVLASSLMGRHRFLEAREAAERLLTADSSSRTARALLGEIQLELGSYDEAARTFGTLRTVRHDLAVAPRYARWEEIRGRPREAQRLLEGALAQAAERHGMPRSQLAWFHWRLADLALRGGRPGEAERRLKAGLQQAPEDHRLLEGLARAAAARGRWHEAIARGERAVARALDPSTLGLLAQAYEVLGDTARAGEYERAMAAAVLRQPEALHRAWGHFLLDRGREVPRVLAQAHDEIRTRRDVYGWDLLAWALYRSGAAVKAAEAAGRALALGTRDASLHFHAGVIAAAAGDSSLARRRLEEALAINPRWHPTQPAEARALLERLP